MKLAHNIKISVFAKPEDNKELIKEKLLSLVPFEIEKEDIKLRESYATGFGQKEIKIVEVELRKDRHINEFLENLNSKLSSDQKELVLRQINSRLDDELKFFIRLDKEKLLKDEFWVTDSGNCFHIIISIAAFPAKVENAIKVVREIFK